MNQENRHITDDLQVAPIQLPSDSYFEELKKNILDEVKKNAPGKTEKTRIIPMYRRWYVWGSAAAILVTVLLFPWKNTDSPVISGSINLSSVSNEEIYNYLDENIEDLDAETIAVHLGSNTLTEGEIQTVQTEQEHTNADFSSKSVLLDHVKDEEILDYLKNDPDIYRDGELDEYLLIES